MKREVTAYIIDADRVNFLLGRETMKEWKEYMIDQAEDVVIFKDKKVRLWYNREENLIVYLEMVEKWEENKDEIEKENEVKSDNEIHSVTVIEQENDEEELRKYLKEIASENLDIEKFIEDCVNQDVSIELVEEGDEVKNDDEIHSVIEKENDKGKIQEQVSEKLDILDIGNLGIAFIEDKSREV